ncbi:MAG TPA: hypothetical protein C5S37_11910, partial [Methanophagales archaeon]|nr:hypothetical protein [Methanophagales archaeon]
MEEELKKAMGLVSKNSAVRYADIRMETGYATAIELRDDVFREMSYGIDQGIGVRVLYKNSWGFSASNDVLKSRLNDTFVDALNIGKSLSLSESNKDEKSVKIADAPPKSDYFVLKPKINPADVSIEEKKHMVKEVYKAAKKHSSRIKTLSILYLDGYEKQTYANSDGSYIVMETPAVFMR